MVKSMAGFASASGTQANFGWTWEMRGVNARGLDVRVQEFSREANTLCLKAQSSTLTRIGLDLKASIDQMREQVQNVE